MQVASKYNKSCTINDKDLQLYLSHVSLDPLGPVGVEEGGDQGVGVHQQARHRVQPHQGVRHTHPACTEGVNYRQGGTATLATLPN